MKERYVGEIEVPGLGGKCLATLQKLTWRMNPRGNQVLHPSLGHLSLIALSFIPLPPTPVMCEPCHMGTSFCLLHTVTEEAEKKGWEGGRSLCSEGISRRSCTL